MSCPDAQGRSLRLGDVVVRKNGERAQIVRLDQGICSRIPLRKANVMIELLAMPLESHRFFQVRADTFKKNGWYRR